MHSTFEDIAELIRTHNIKIIDFKQIDLAGRWHHLSIPVERFTPDMLVKGIGFDGSSYGFLTVEKSDMVFIPDLSSAFVDPVVETPTLVMISDIFRVDGERSRFESDPRHIAYKAESFLTQTGIADQCLFGPEFEFYLLDDVEFRIDSHHIEAHLDSRQATWNSADSGYDAPGHNLGYKVQTGKGYHVDLPRDSTFDLRNLMVRTLEEHGVPVKYHHGENGAPGQVEIEVQFSTLQNIADETMKLKYLVKNLAMQHGKTATFMPKPFFDECGNGMHVHMHMFKEGQPVFFDETGYASLSRTALHAIGGVLSHASALTGLTCPSTNSYKRLVPGFEAPVTIGFGLSNRSSVIRIPGYATNPADKRFEFRPSDATANPYLAFSALLMAAIDGIQRELDPVELGFGPYDKNLFDLSAEESKRLKHLPHSLEEAADALEADHEFLLNGGVFTGQLIGDHLAKLRQDAADVSVVPHPIEFAKYYDL